MAMAMAAAAVAARSPAGGADGRGIRPGPRRPRPPTRREGAPPPAGRRFAAARPRLRGRRGGMGLRARGRSRPLPRSGGRRAGSRGRAGRPRLRVRVPARSLRASIVRLGVVVLHRQPLHRGGAPFRLRAHVLPKGEGDRRSGAVRVGPRPGLARALHGHRHPRAALRRRRAGQPLRPGPRRRRRREAADLERQLEHRVAAGCRRPGGRRGPAHPGADRGEPGRGPSPHPEAPQAGGRPRPGRG